MFCTIRPQCACASAMRRTWMCLRLGPCRFVYLLAYLSMLSIALLWNTSNHLSKGKSGVVQQQRRESENKVFLAILVLTAPKNFGKRDAIRRSWLSEETSDVRHYFALGTKLLTQQLLNSIVKEQQMHKDILMLPHFHDSYKGLPKKLLASLVEIHSNISYEFLLKCDDDTYLRLNYLKSELKELPDKRRIYMGFFNNQGTVLRKGLSAERKWSLCDMYIPYASGNGYIISNDLISFIISNSELLKIYNNEDASMGAWLSPIKINRIFDIRFDTRHKSFGCRNDQLITTTKSAKLMLETFEQLRSQKVFCKTEDKLLPLLPYRTYNWNVPPALCCQ